jgi:hypothetical protein
VYSPSAIQESQVSRAGGAYTGEGSTPTGRGTEWRGAVKMIALAAVKRFCC